MTIFQQISKIIISTKKKKKISYIFLNILEFFIYNFLKFTKFNIILRHKHTPVLIINIY